MNIKTTLHPRNKHRKGYDFISLIDTYPELSNYIIQNKYNQQDTIDFSNASAVRALNTALLKKYYQIEFWRFPQDYLCPPIPGRVDYIHYLSDLLRETNGITKNPISVLDIGTGASCIYPILGAREYDWSFVASDIDPISIKAANKIIADNKNIAQKVKCRLQKNSSKIFDGIIKENEFYHLTMCNPPFHKSLSDASSGSNRKWQNLNKANSSKNENFLNFGGQKAELWCHGGELGFIRQMIKESKEYQNQVLWFTCLISKKDHLSKIKLYLKKAKASQVKVIKMTQGQKISRFIAWGFS
jgi:23S rRNA (adenine1618-N6)-methyltransferase